MTATTDETRKTEMMGVVSVRIVLDDDLSKVVIIETQDIRECYFVEDIFSYCMTGKLLFIDRYGIHENGPFTGNELVVITYGKKYTREVAFRFWRVKEIAQVSNQFPESENMMEIFFVDTTYEQMIIPQYSISFKPDTTHNYVIDYLFKNMIGWNDNNIQIEESYTKFDNGWIMPYWTVLESIKWIMARMSSHRTNTSGFLCYNNTEKVFGVNVKTLNWLLGEYNKMDKREYVLYSAEVETDNKILSWWISGQNKSTIRKIRGSNWKGYNFEEKRLISSSFTYDDGVNYNTMLGKYTLFNDINYSNTEQNMIYESDENAIKNLWFDDWSRRYNLQNLLNIVVAGNEERFAGLQIDINWPSGSREIEIYHKLLRGTYLIKSITHNFIPTDFNYGYQQRMVLIKNAYQDANSKSLIKSKRINVTNRNKKQIIREG